MSTISPTVVKLAQDFMGGLLYFMMFDAWLSMGFMSYYMMMDMMMSMMSLPLLMF